MRLAEPCAHLEGLTRPGVRATTAPLLRAQISAYQASLRKTQAIEEQ